MRYKIHKCFWAWNYDKEEKWLNQMSAKGLQLVSIGLFNFVFEDGQPNEYTYKIELLEKLPTHSESLQYIRFLEEAQVEYVGSYMRWAYFRAKTDNGSFELYSDIESKIKHNNRILALFIIFMPMNIYWAIFNLINYISKRYGFVLFASVISFLVCGLLGWGIVQISRKNRKLKKQKNIQE